MSLPVILEVAIGLIFVYLTLSLLASEIQQILGSLLQWRAEHLKRSIEVLLSGNDSDSQAIATELSDQLYNSPLIKSLNHEATGPIGKSFRLLNQAIGSLYRTLTRNRNVFGSNTSGPSYIPSSVFAKSLIERLQLDEARNLLIDSRLRNFVEEKLLLPINHIVNDLRASTANEFLLNSELRQLEVSVGQIIQDFKDKRTSLSEAIERLVDRLDDFSEMAQDVLPDNHHLTETFMRRLSYLRRAVSKNTLEQSVLLKKIRPRLQELIAISDQESQIFQELKLLRSTDKKASEELLKRLQSQTLPPSLERSLASMIRDLQPHLNDVEDDISYLTNHVESWFDQSMERAAGVYRRNAKAVGLLIGFGIAISLNVDSLHMLERFSNDPTIRQTISRSAEQFAVENPDLTSTEQMAILQSSVDETLRSIPLPIGYQQRVLEQQEASEANWSYPIPRRFLGWLVTAVAISMGAGFWFDLLKKIVSVKNSTTSSS